MLATSADPGIKGGEMSCFSSLITTTASLQHWFTAHNSTGSQSAAAAPGGSMSSPLQSVVYYVGLYKHDEHSPTSYYRLRGADHAETLKALFRAGLGPLSHYPAGRAGPSGVSRVSAKIRWRRRERDLVSRLVEAYGGYTRGYHYRNADYEQAFESLSAVGFVGFDRISDVD